MDLKQIFFYWTNASFYWTNDFNEWTVLLNARYCTSTEQLLSKKTSEMDGKLTIILRTNETNFFWRMKKNNEMKKKLTRPFLALRVSRHWIILNCLRGYAKPFFYPYKILKFAFIIVYKFNLLSQKMLIKNPHKYLFEYLPPPPIGISAPLPPLESLPQRG